MEPTENFIHQSFSSFREGEIEEKNVEREEQLKDDVLKTSAGISPQEGSLIVIPCLLILIIIGLIAKEKVRNGSTNPFVRFFAFFPDALGTIVALLSKNEREEGEGEGKNDPPSAKELNQVERKNQKDEGHTRFGTRKERGLCVGAADKSKPSTSGQLIEMQTFSSVQSPKKNSSGEDLEKHFAVLESVMQRKKLDKDLKKAGANALDKINEAMCPIVQERSSHLQMDKEMFGFIRRLVSGKRLTDEQFEKTKEFVNEWKTLLCDESIYEEVEITTVPKFPPPPVPSTSQVQTTSDETPRLNRNLYSEIKKESRTKVKKFRFQSPFKKSKNGGKRSKVKEEGTETIVLKTFSTSQVKAEEHDSVESHHEKNDETIETEDSSEGFPTVSTPQNIQDASEEGEFVRARKLNSDDNGSWNFDGHNSDEEVTFKSPSV